MRLFIIGLMLMAISTKAFAVTPLAFGVECDDIKVIVNHHNHLRRSLAQGKVAGQPKASNMQPLVWDEDLAIVAQNWANNMEFKHNPGRSDPRFQVGENIYISFSSDVDERKYDWKGAVDSWFAENVNYTYAEKFQFDYNTGHYTQVAWADSIFVGCGAATYIGDDGNLNMLYVCDYGPAGNFGNAVMYKTGEGCDNMCCISKEYDCHKKYGSSC